MTDPTLRRTVAGAAVNASSMAGTTSGTTTGKTASTPASTPAGTPASAPRSADTAQAGALLRAARQQQGLHIAALAASIKVSPAKLEALEAGRTHELPDATFTRALALTVCRVLKTDAAPVLALLPGAPPGSLERVDSGLNTPFRERAGQGDASQWLPWRHPVLWLVGVLLVAAAAFVLVPSQSSLLPMLTGADAALPPVMPPSGAGVANPVPADVATPSAADAAPAAASGVPGLAAPAVAPDAAPVAAPVAAPLLTPAAGRANGADVLVLRAVQSTWVQATDGSGQTLMARVVPAGETVELTPVLPVRLRIGNVQGTELQFRGKAVNLVSPNRDNIANITLP